MGSLLKSPMRMALCAAGAILALILLWPVLWFIIKTLFTVVWWIVAGLLSFIFSSLLAGIGLILGLALIGAIVFYFGGRIPGAAAISARFRQRS